MVVFLVTCEAWQSQLSVFVLLVLRFRFLCWGHHAYSPVWIIQFGSRETLRVTPSLTRDLPSSSQWKCNLCLRLNVTDCCAKSHQVCNPAVKLHLRQPYQGCFGNFIHVCRHSIVLGFLQKQIFSPAVILCLSVGFCMCVFLFCYMIIIKELFVTNNKVAPINWSRTEIWHHFPWLAWPVTDLSILLVSAWTITLQRLSIIVFGKSESTIIGIGKSRLPKKRKSKSVKKIAIGASLITE